MNERPIMITGGSGQLAQALVRLSGERRVVHVGRPDFDFEAPDRIESLLERLRPSIILNAAAYTAVDQAERDSAEAWRANASGPGLLAQWCAGNGSFLIHISTDYVFDGNKGAPYVEEDVPNPGAVYGASKLAGEQLVVGLLPTAVILRTSWVFGATGKNFMRTMLNAAIRNSQLRVVSDQIGCPTGAIELADVVWKIADQMPLKHPGVFHAACSGWTSWHGFAEAIFAEAAAFGHPRPEVAAINTSDWPTPVRRPRDSRLDCSLLSRELGIALPTWQVSLSRAVSDYFATTDARSGLMPQLS